MADLVAIGYDDETTASQAAKEVECLADDLVIEPDAIAVIVRDGEGKYSVTTNHHAVGAGASYGMFWGPLFGFLFFVPVFGMAIGTGLSALMNEVARTGIDEQFQERIRKLLKPGTSALFVVLEEVTPDKAAEALGEYGGTVVKSTLA